MRHVMLCTVSSYIRAVVCCLACTVFFFSYCGTFDQVWHSSVQMSQKTSDFRADARDIETFVNMLSYR